VSELIPIQFLLNLLLLTLPLPGVKAKQFASHLEPSSTDTTIPTS